MAINYGLSSTGFKRKRLAEIQQSLRDRLTEKFGLQIQTGANSILGQLIDIYAYEIADLWENAEQVYNAMYPSTASGTALSNAAGLAGIAQITAERTKAVLMCKGTSGTSIPYGTQVASSVDSDIIFSCIETDASIDAGTACKVVLALSDSVASDTEYTLTYNGVAYSYTASESDSAAIVLNALAEQIAEIDSDITTSIENDELTIAESDLTDTFSVAVSNLVINELYTPITFQCTTFGAIEPGTDEITSIVTAIDGFDECTNISATVGRDNETDTALRQRWSASVYDRASAMVEAISAGIYANVTGVTACVVYENTSDETDSESRPPHSIECVVQGGADEDIAAEIWRLKAAGIDTYGSTSAEVTDSMGIVHTMYFNRPTAKPIYLQVVISENPEETLPSAAITDIAAALLEKGEEQAVGEDVILQKYFATIFNATTGVGYISLTASTDGETYSTDNIEISDREVATFDSSRIEVTQS